MADDVEETVEVQETESDTDDNSDTSTEARQHALEDARRVVDHELKSLNDVTRKAWRVVQFNGLVATVFAALVPPQSGLSQIDWVSGIILVGAVIALGYSTYLAYRTQERESVKTGPESQIFRALSEHDYEVDAYLSRSLEIYADCLDSLQPTTEEKSEDVDQSLIISLIGVILLLVGTLWIFVT